MNKQELIDELTKYVKRYEDEMDEYDQGRLGAYRVALALTRQLDEPQKPVVPKFVAEWIENLRKQLVSYHFESGARFMLLLGSDFHFNTAKLIDDKIQQWLEEDGNEVILSNAIDYGYEVEKEPLYYVRLPFEVWDEDAAELKTEYFYLHYDITSDETRLFTTKKTMKDFVSKLDEATIKSADEKYWAFAVPVEQEEKHD